MRMLRCLIAVTLVCCTVPMAKASNFAMVVVDPLPAASEVTLITADNFSVTLSTCNSDQLFGLSASTWIGCFSGENDTGAPLTSLQVLIPLFSFGGSQETATCPTGISQSVFKTITCGTTTDGLDYFLDFSGGNIAAATGINGDCDNDGDGGSALNDDDIACNERSIFTIAESGVTADSFPKDFSVKGNVAATPEPDSFWLLATGVLTGGFFMAHWRRRALCAVRP